MRRGRVLLRLRHITSLTVEQPLHGRGRQAALPKPQAPGRSPLRQGYAGGIDLSREGVFVAIVGQGRSLRCFRCNTCLEQCVQCITKVDVVE